MPASHYIDIETLLLTLSMPVECLLLITLLFLQFSFSPDGYAVLNEPVMVINFLQLLTLAIVQAL